MIWYTHDNGAHTSKRPSGQLSASNGLRQCKASVFEGGIRVGGFVHWPQVIQGHVDTLHAAVTNDSCRPYWISSTLRTRTRSGQVMACLCCRCCVAKCHQHRLVQRASVTALVSSFLGSKTSAPRECGRSSRTQTRANVMSSQN